MQKDIDYPNLNYIEKPLYYVAKSKGINLDYEKTSVRYLNENWVTKTIKPDFIYKWKSDQIKIAIECDGKSHDDPKQQKKDKIRDDTLKEEWYEVMRFRTMEIWENCWACVKKIKEKIRMLEEKYRISAIKRKKDLVKV